MEAAYHYRDTINSLLDYVVDVVGISRPVTLFHMPIVIIQSRIHEMIRQFVRQIFRNASSGLSMSKKMFQNSATDILPPVHDYGKQWRASRQRRPTISGARRSVFKDF